MGVHAPQRRRSAPALALAVATASLAAGCGGGGTQQDVSEPSGSFPVRVVGASFPATQSLAKPSELTISVSNAGQSAVPNVNVTVKCGAGLGGSFDTVSSNTDLADPQRPQFIVNRLPTRGPTYNRPSLDSAPLERSSAYVDTYPLGRLQPGASVTFRWNVTAVKAGPYRVCYRVNAGLYGKAKAVAASGGLPIAGTFTGTISDAAPKTDIGPDLHSVTRQQGQ